MGRPRSGRFFAPAQTTATFERVNRIRAAEMSIDFPAPRCTPPIPAEARNGRIRPPSMPVVAGTAPPARTVCSTGCAVAAFSGATSSPKLSRPPSTGPPRTAAFPV